MATRLLDLRTTAHTLTALLCVCIMSSCTVTNVYMVRHAEKQITTNPDPHLSDPGQKRAVTLAKMLRDKKIKSIYTTNLNRTRETATPLKDTLGLTLTFYANDTLNGFVNRVKMSRRNALVVGHSNTLPAMFDAIPVAHSITNICEEDFDNFFILKIKRYWYATKAYYSLSELTYGNPTECQ